VDYVIIAVNIFVCLLFSTVIQLFGYPSANMQNETPG